MNGRPDQEFSALEPDGRDLLARFARALQKYGLYPPDHPSLEPAARQLAEGIGELLEERERLSVGVAPRQLFLGERASDPSNTQLTALAGHLHAHEVGRITFVKPPEASELHAFLTELRQKPDEATSPLARREGEWDWEAFRVEPVWYEQLELGEGDTTEGTPGRSEAARLWMDMARATGAVPAAEAEQEEGELVSAADLATALEDAGATDRADRRVIEQFLEILRSMNPEDGPGDGGIQEQLGRLIQALDRDRLTEMLTSVEPDRTRKLLSASTRHLPTGAVVDLLDGAARTETLGLSRWMLLLLGKLSRHAEDQGGLGGAEADGVLRANVRGLAEMGEEEGGHTRDGYSAALQEMAHWSGASAGGTAQEPKVEPERVLMMSLEVDRFGEMGREAVDEMADAGQTARAVTLASEAPAGSEVTEALWNRLADSGSLRALLTEEGRNLDAVEKLASRMGIEAAPALLDVLANAESRNVRMRLFNLLSDMGPELTEPVTDRLDDDRWYVVRNMLALLAELPTGDTVDVLPFTGHEHPAVREEAYRLQFRKALDVEHLRQALGDPAPRVVRRALALITPSAPEELLPKVLTVLDDPPDQQTERAAIRAVARCDSPAVRERLLDRCRRSSTILRLLLGPLASSSDPVVLEALKALSTGPFDGEDVDRLLEAARASGDPEVRKAATAGEA